MGTAGLVGTGGGEPPRVMSASTARSKNRLRHKESVFSSVKREERRQVAEWADRALNRQEADAAAAAAAAAESGSGAGAASGMGSRRPWVSPASMNVGSGTGGGLERAVTPGGATSAYHSSGAAASYPSWFDDNDNDNDDDDDKAGAAAGMKMGIVNNNNNGKGGGGVGGAAAARGTTTTTQGKAAPRRPVSAAFQKEAQLLSYSMRPAGRAVSARAQHNGAFVTAVRKGQAFGEPPAGFSEIRKQRDRAVARQAAHEAREAAKEAAAKTARIEAQKQEFKDRVAEGTLHKAMLGDPFTVRKISARQRVAGKEAARADRIKRIGVVPPVDTVTGVMARATGTGTGTGTGLMTGKVFDGKYGTFVSGGGGGEGKKVQHPGQQATTKAAKKNMVSLREAQAITEALAALDDFDSKPMPTMPKNAPMLFRMT